MTAIRPGASPESVAAVAGDLTSHTTAAADAHPIGAVTGLTDALAGKAAVAHETALTGVHGIVVKNVTSTGLGRNALLNATTAGAVTAIGVDAGKNLTTGDYNVAVGAYALQGATTGAVSVAVGWNAAPATNTGGTTAIGGQTLMAQTTGQNTAFGYRCLAGLTTGSQNVGAGVATGRFLADGTTANQTAANGVYVGNDVRASVAGVTNETVIGYTATGGGSNTVRLGNSSVTNWLPGDTNKVALGRSDLAFKELYLHDGTDEWKVTINTSGVLTTTKV